MPDFDDLFALLAAGETWRAAEILLRLGEARFEAVSVEVVEISPGRGQVLEILSNLTGAPDVPGGTLERERLLRLEAMRMLAVALAHAAAQEEWRDLAAVIKALSSDASYRVREAAVRLIARVASARFGETKEFWRECLAGDDPVVAGNVLRGLAASDAPAPEVLDLFAVAMADMRKDVRHSLGPRALAELGRREPRVVYDRLAAWAKETDEIVRWNISQALATPLGAAFPEEAMDILAMFAADERPAVWRAAAKAIIHIAQRRPAFVLPMLKGWRGDFMRHRCANLVLETLARR